METSKNINVEGEQDASASAPASPTTASTAAVQQAPQINSFFQLERTSPTQAVPATGPPPAAADLAPRNTTPLQVCGSSGSTLQAVLRYPPRAQPAGVRACYHTPSFTYYTHTPWGWSDAPGLSHPLTYPVGQTRYHTPWFVTPLGAAATCTLSPGLHKMPHPPQDTTPGDNIVKRSNVSPGVCYLV